MGMPIVEGPREGRYCVPLVGAFSKPVPDRDRLHLVHNYSEIGDLQLCAHVGAIRSRADREKINGCGERSRAWWYKPGLRSGGYASWP